MLKYIHKHIDKDDILNKIKHNSKNKKVTKMYIKMRKLIVSIILALTPLSPLLISGIAHAATDTWTGGGSNGNWSTAANWSGGVAPVNGDSVVINNAANFSNGSIIDTALTLNSITFTGDASGGVVDITLGAGLTINSAITQDTTVTNTEDTIKNAGTGQTITLGGNVTITSNSGGSSSTNSSPLTLGDIAGTPDTINLNGNTLTFTNTGGANYVSIGDAITGAGTVTYDGTSNYQLSNANSTYSGTTNVNTMVGEFTANDNGFGSSTINVLASGEVSFDNTSSGTISNPIVITGLANGTPNITSLDFSEGLGTNNVISLNVPNITLNGSTRFYNGSAIVNNANDETVNLLGIKSNGFCIEYLGANPAESNNGPANGFINGPAGCVLMTTTSKAPNTGFGLTNEPVAASAVGGVMLGGGLLGVSYRIRKASLRK